MAKKFFYVCAGIFLLALSYHLGANNATAQGPGNPIVAAAGVRVYLANGDVYEEYGNPYEWRMTGNIFMGAPTEAQQESWGAVKQRYRR